MSTRQLTPPPAQSRPAVARLDLNPPGRADQRHPRLPHLIQSPLNSERKTLMTELNVFTNERRVDTPNGRLFVRDMPAEDPPIVKTGSGHSRFQRVGGAAVNPTPARASERSR